MDDGSQSNKCHEVVEIPTEHKTEKFCENSRPTVLPGTLRATNAMAVTSSLRLMKQPR